MTNSPSIPPPEVAERLGQIFMPTATRARARLYPSRAGTARFVHYTTAEAALKIIGSKVLWMRNATCMSDYREVNHGHDMLVKLFGKPQLRDEFVGALDASNAGVALQAIGAFDNNWTAIRSGTYIASVSEHEPREDLHGRLSMWRAVGAGSTRVAIVISIPWQSGAAQALGVVFSPVAYLREEEVEQEMFAVAKNVRDNQPFLAALPNEMVRGTVFTMLLSAVICLKHEGFAEEREWRAFYEALWQGHHQIQMQHSLESVNGIPQRVYHIPLDGKPDSAIFGLNVAAIFDRLIIGPTQFPGAMADAFIEALGGAGVAEPAKKVVASLIPIRT